MIAFYSELNSHCYSYITDVKYVHNISYTIIIIIIIMIIIYTFQSAITS